MMKKPLDTFICLDCEATGLNTKDDRIIEIAIAKFHGDKILSSFETLIDPKCDIPLPSIEIHNISQDMVKGKPGIEEVLAKCLKMIEGHIIIGHGILFDIDLIDAEAKRHQIACNIKKQTYIDTLRLARLYGESPVNSLEYLRSHFNIPQEGAHRAMNDVVVNIKVFNHLIKQFNSTKQILERLKKPIQLKTMPLGKHKGRVFSDIPIDYLKWAARQEFDQDLLFSIRSELARRKKLTSFKQASNPFLKL